MNKVTQMKWWGWGAQSKIFNIENKPHLWPYAVNACGLDTQSEQNHLPCALESISLPEPTLNADFLTAIKSIFSAEQIHLDREARLHHCYGKSLRDLWRIRNGIIDSAPDCICYPETEEEIQAVMVEAVRHHVILIPFGGGSNIAGCLEAKINRRHMVVVLNMRRMQRVLAMDPVSMTARIQAGASGPQLEQQLNAQGMTLGHFPDSFEFSTIGGWVATRSAGMQSDKYGKIEDMVLALRMVTPAGLIVTRTVPRAANGIDIKHLCIGSEGILGVITEITLQIHRQPEKKVFCGYLFPSFEKGVAALHQCVMQNCSPSMVRLNDKEKTALSFAYKTQGSWLETKLSQLFKWYLKTIKRFDFQEAALMLVAFEGSKKAFAHEKHQVEKIYQQFGGVSLGKSPGLAFEKGKYDFPYLRDFLLDRGVGADVSETATTWQNLLPLYYKAQAAILAAIGEQGAKPWCACHISHTYHTGASLYFTFAFKQRTGAELEQYLHIKKAAEDAFIEYGGTLSHHHAVGYEHLPWITQDISETGVLAVQGLKQKLDPLGIMNPGKIIPSAEPLYDWGWR